MLPREQNVMVMSGQALREADGGRLTRQVYLTEFYNRKKAR